MKKKYSSALFTTSFLSVIFLPSFVAYFLNPENIKYFNKLVYIVSFIHFGLLLLFFLTIGKRENNKFFNSLIVIPNKINNVFFFFFLAAFTIISQSYYLQFETISWDIPTYLVAANSIDLQTLPYVDQWETKGPLLMYIYSLLIFLSNHSYIIFKIICDIILFLISFILFQTFYLLNKTKILSFFSAILFLSLFSDPEYTAEFSELFTLFFVAFAFYYYIKYKTSENFSSKRVLIVGILISFASLTNQVAAIFAVPFLIELKYFQKLSYKKLFIYVLGLTLPQVIFQLLYLINDYFYIYILNYFYLPLGYTEYYENHSFSQLKIWFKEYFYFNKWLYFSFISIFILQVLNVRNLKKSFLNNSILYFMIFTSVSIYVLGNTNYGHHLFYFVYFSCLLMVNIVRKELTILVSILIFLSSSIIFASSFKQSTFNLVNLKSVEQEYPLNQLSKEISKYINEDSKILALDSVLILYYLDQPNFSYIVHPTNHFFDFITKYLVEVNRINKNEIELLISQFPDVVICSTKRVGQGGQTIFNENFDCSEKQFNEKIYFQLDTNKYVKNQNIAYFYDGIKDLKVFIKINN